MKRSPGFAAAIASAAALFAFSLHQSRAFGQNAPSAVAPGAAASATPAPDIEGSGEQLRALAAVYAAWSQDRRPKSGNDSPDITAYRFRVAESGANYTVTLWPKKPIVKRIPTPSGVRLESESSTFSFTVRRSDFRIVGRSAIM